MTALPDIPEFPTLHAELDGTGRGRLILPDGEHTITAEPDECGPELIRRVAEYAAGTLKRPVRLKAVDPHAERLFGVHPDGHADELAPPTPIADTALPPDSEPEPGPPVEDPAGEPAESRPSLRAVPVAPADSSHAPVEPAPAGPDAAYVPLSLGRDTAPDPPSPSDPPPPDPPPAAAAVAAGPGRPVATEARDDGPLDRLAMYAQPPGPLARLAARLSTALMDVDERRERDLDAELAKRHVLEDTACIVIASSKGGVAKSANTIQLGACLAAFLPNQRVAAVDFNVGGGALAAAAGVERAARHTLFELHRDLAKITRHSLLQPYVSSLPCGLDIITVPPRPELALAITPEHYQELFDRLLINAYDVLLLDCSPDIISPVTRWALEHGTQLVISTEQGYTSGSVVQHALGYLLAQPAASDGHKAIAVINKVIADPRAGRVEETERSLRAASAGMPIIRIPFDLDIPALIASGHYSTELIKRRATRLPIKQLAVEVCRRFH